MILLGEAEKRLGQAGIRTEGAQRWSMGLRWVVVLWVCVGWASGLQAQIRITSFRPTGALTWSGAFTNGSVTVEKASDWQSKKWTRVTRVRTTNEVGGVNIPLLEWPVYFRLVAADLTPPPPPDPPGMRKIPAGTFRMGDSNGVGGPEELPVHEVYISEFFMEQYEITNEKMRQVLQWAYDAGRVTVTFQGHVLLKGTRLALVGLKWGDPVTQPDNTRAFNMLDFANGEFFVLPGMEEFPCIGVSWNGAVAYCNYRSEMEGLETCYDLTTWTCDFTKAGYRLPTEAEWEKAARGGLVDQLYPWPSPGRDFLRAIDQSKATYTPVGQPHPWSMKRTGYYDGTQVPAGVDMANGYGLYDMAGNAREWCWDWYDAAYYASPEASKPDPTGPLTGTLRTQRGASFDQHQKGLRCAARDFQLPAWPDAASWYNGFRPVRRR